MEYQGDSKDLKTCARSKGEDQALMGKLHPLLPMGFHSIGPFPNIGEYNYLCTGEHKHDSFTAVIFIHT